ncbi:hypothetical protein [Streptomyces sp. NPDC018045]|uniref:hypothetical protein n=1 Tax=Streptomyces sp. NPDC018045 TaxID=3365037 RepID=UPI0037BC7844
MRTSRLISTGAALATAAVLMSAPTGLAATAPAPDSAAKNNLVVSPNPVRAGGTVTVSTTACSTRNNATVHASRSGIPGVRDIGLSHDGRKLTGKLRIPVGTKPGTYRLRGNCGHGGSGPTPLYGAVTVKAPRAAVE